MLESWSMKKLFKGIGIAFLVLVVIGIFAGDNNKESSSGSDSKSSYSSNDDYLKCYGEMTAAHKARGFHERNREASIKVKTEICELYADGKITDYEGKR